MLDSDKKTQTLPQAATDMKTAFQSRLLPGTPDVEVVRNRSSNWKLTRATWNLFHKQGFFFLRPQFHIPYNCYIKHNSVGF